MTFLLYAFLFHYLLLVHSLQRTICINVYGIEDNKMMIYPLGVSQTVVSGRHVDLLLYECNGIQHYTTIKNFSRLVSSQLSNHNSATYCCKKCLHAYSTQELLIVHAEYCCHTQTTKFPKDPKCRFTNIQKQLPATFVVYADFECYIRCRNWHTVFASCFPRAHPL